MLAVILGVVEGVTEFLPVSSTGHLILVGHFLGFHGVKASTFEIFIQSGAMFAVIIMYRRRFYRLCTFRQDEGFSGLHGIWLIGLTTLPAVVVGWLTHEYIKMHLFHSLTVAIGLGVGGLGLLVAERVFPRGSRFGLEVLTWKDALRVGLFQCLALWPGVSRSASTIVGGMMGALDRKTAAEYSFLAAVPIMLMAAVFDLYKNIGVLSGDDAVFFGTGFLVAFASAWLAIKFFIGFLGTHTLKPFGWYRIGLAIVVMIWLG